MSMNQMRKPRHREGRGGLPGVGRQGKGTVEATSHALSTCWVSAGGQTHRSPAQGPLSTPFLPEGDMWQDTPGHWHQCQQVNTG